MTETNKVSYLSWQKGCDEAYGNFIESSVKCDGEVR